MSWDTTHGSESNEILSALLGVLIQDYRDMRREGILLTHSFFRDVYFFMAGLAAVAGGGLVFKEPRLLLSLPLLLVAMALYVTTKIRVSILITNYLFYLEDKINRQVNEPLLVWQSVLIKPSLSAHPKSKYGKILASMAGIVSVPIYGVMCWFVYVQNQALFVSRPALSASFIVLAVLFLAVLLSVFVRSRRFHREFIEKEDIGTRVASYWKELGG